MGKWVKIKNMKQLIEEEICDEDEFKKLSWIRIIVGQYCELVEEKPGKLFYKGSFTSNFCNYHDDWVEKTFNSKKEMEEHKAINI